MEQIKDIDQEMLNAWLEGPTNASTDIYIISDNMPLEYKCEYLCSNIGLLSKDDKVDVANIIIMSGESGQLCDELDGCSVNLNKLSSALVNQMYDICKIRIEQIQNVKNSSVTALEAAAISKDPAQLHLSDTTAAAQFGRKISGKEAIVSTRQEPVLKVPKVRVKKSSGRGKQLI